MRRDLEHPRRSFVIALAAAVVGIASLASCASDEGEQSATGPGAGHVHALGLNPRDGALFIATHNGLFRLPTDSERAERVGDRRQDTMGFTVVGPNHFLGSGHPDLRDDLPPLLGLIESRDGGKTWTPISLLGKVDFHALRAQGRRVVGYDATSGRVMISDNGGQDWTIRNSPEPLVDLVVNPTSAGNFLAAGTSRLFVSRDAGRSWRVREQGTGLLAWPRRDRIYLLDGGGRIWLSRDGASRWQQGGQIGGRPAALLAADAEVLYAATHEGAIKHSGDGGSSWRLVGHL